MSRGWPRVEYTESGMREGMQIEDASISVEDKVRLLDALGETGLKSIVVGSFVRPEYTPQMARVDEILERFHPRPGVKYTALIVNPKGRERAERYVPPLTIERPRPRLAYPMCDVFHRRNYNRSQEQELAAWPQTVARAQEAGAQEASIGVHAAWGSNFTGEYTLDQVMEPLERAHRLWDEAGIPVTDMYLGDPMSWVTPHRVEEYLTAIKERWPEVRHFDLHFHDGRGMAVVATYAAMRALEPEDTLYLEGTIGGIGGCPYCGNGRTTGMAPTEDLMHMLEGMGFETGVDMDRMIDCVWMLEEILGRPTMGHVAKAGPRPVKPEQWYDPNLPFVETFEEAWHFKLGPGVCEHQRRPWREPIRSYQRPETLGL